MGPFVYVGLNLPLCLRTRGKL